MLIKYSLTGKLISSDSDINNIDFINIHDAEAMLAMATDVQNIDTSDITAEDLSNLCLISEAKMRADVVTEKSNTDSTKHSRHGNHYGYFKVVKMTGE